MSDLMRLIPFENLINWSLAEYEHKGSIFGVRKEKFYNNKSGKTITMFNDELGSPIGPAAGPNSQLSQNIIASYLAGCRFIELKTIQIMDGEEIRSCVKKPCINAEDECYNVEWSTELTVEEALEEYVKSWFVLHVLAKELGLSSKRDFAFNMSVGYDLEGIKGPKVNGFIETMKDASKHEVFKHCKEYLLENISLFKNITKEDIEAIETCVCSSITLSTLHGCPPEEIDKISRYLLSEKKVHTYIKCNPTLLGYEFARNILNEMGYGYISFDSHHFDNDLQWADGVKMLDGLMSYAKEQGLSFGVKLTNTFPVEVTNNELPGEEMYMSGRSLFPLTISLANKLSKHFDGKLPIAFSGGADHFNIADIFKTGIQPITVATTVLKPGGYERITQIAKDVEPLMQGAFKGIDLVALDKLATNVVTSHYYVKDARTVGSRKTSSKLPLIDCAKAPCKDGGCPINQQIPEYLSLVSEKKYAEAFKVIAKDNTAPGITGTICDHQCQNKCTRLDYEAPLAIRAMKKIASDHSQEDFIKSIVKASLKTKKKVAVIGAGPAGLGTALFLRRNGVDVTVFEQRQRPYGTVEYIIPEFRIPKATIERDFKLVEAEGVNFKFGVDKNIDLKALQSEYDYVVLSIGALKEGYSPVEEGSENVLDALAFLEASKAADCQLDLGKTVVVIGGGDVAMDCARAAKRAKGVERSIIVYRRTREFMPAEHEEINLAIEDGVEIVELLAPVSFLDNTLLCEKMVLGARDASGRKGINGTGEMLSIKIDTLIGATGARVDTEVFTGLGLEVDKKGTPVVSAQNESSKADVYVAGDCKKGPSTIVKAIADGKIIAKDILNKCGLENDFVNETYKQDIATLYTKKGILEARKNDETEGTRCLSCDDICELCCDVCPNRANIMIEADFGFAQNHQIVHLDGMCNECGNCGVFCPHTGNPYKDKLTLFWTEEDFVDSTNKGYLPVGGDKYKVRKEDGQVVNYTFGEKGVISEEMAKVLATLKGSYPYYFVNI